MAALSNHGLFVEGQLDGVWLNADCPWEFYTVTGQRVIRANSQGFREFSIRWDPGRLSWQWGRHGRLTMQWLGVDSIAWVPDISSSTIISRIRTLCNWHRSTRRTTYSKLHQGSNNNKGEHPHTHRQHNHHPRRDRSRSRSRNWHRSYRRRCWCCIGQGEASLPCGLTHREVYSLLSREITPEDYEMLLRLDEAIPKKQATEKETNEALHVVSCEEFLGKECPICLTRYLQTDDV
ncbi:unnamed protein product, partial [Durusdinium trenchii]